MATSRRDFLKTASAAAATIGVNACVGSQQPPASLPRPDTSPSPAAASPTTDASYRELAMLALDAARSAGAQYADVRISRNRVQSISTRERRVQGLSDNETFGFGVRTLVGGAWGFAASSDLTRDEVARIARQAAAQAKSNRAALVKPVACGR